MGWQQTKHAPVPTATGDCQFCWLRVPSKALRRSVSDQDNRRHLLKVRAERTITFRTAGQRPAIRKVQPERTMDTAVHSMLTRILSDPGVTVIIVEHRDRLMRFGFEHLAATMSACGRTIVGVRRYGRRCASRSAAEVVAGATGVEP